MARGASGDVVEGTSVWFMLVHVGCSLVCCALVCCSTLVCCALVCCTLGRTLGRIGSVECLFFLLLDCWNYNDEGDLTFSMSLLLKLWRRYSRFQTSVRRGRDTDEPPSCNGKTCLNWINGTPGAPTLNNCRSVPSKPPAWGRWRLSGTWVYK